MKILNLFFISLVSSSFGQSKVGSARDIDVNDPTVEQLLTENLARLDAGESGSFSLISKTKVTSQVVSGISYKITGTFKIGDGEEIECCITIWSRPWLQADKNEAVKIKAECGEENKLYKDKQETLAAW